MVDQEVRVVKSFLSAWWIVLVGHEGGVVDKFYHFELNH
jgi:hypothetical protein